MVFRFNNLDCAFRSSVTGLSTLTNSAARFHLTSAQLFPLTVRDSKLAPCRRNRVTISWYSNSRLSIYRLLILSLVYWNLNHSKNAVVSLWPPETTAVSTMIFPPSCFGSLSPFSKHSRMSFLPYLAASVSGYSPRILRLLKSLPALIK